MKRSISENLASVASLATAKDRVEALRRLGQESPAYEYVLKLALDPGAKWALPEGDPPYKPCEVLDNEGVLFAELRRLYLFLDPSVPGSKPDLRQNRREQLFIELLETVSTSDAKLLIAMKDKKLPWKELDKKTVQKAFPKIF